MVASSFVGFDIEWTNGVTADQMSLKAAPPVSNRGWQVLESSDSLELELGEAVEWFATLLAGSHGCAPKVCRDSAAPRYHY